MSPVCPGSGSGRGRGHRGAQPRLCVPVQRDNWAVEEVIRIPPKDVSGWIMPKMPGPCALGGGIPVPSASSAARQSLADPKACVTPNPV